MSALQQPLPPVESPMIYRIIPQVMKEIGSVEKSQRNETQKYAFRGIEQFYQAAHPAFVKYGIFCAPEVLDREATTFEKINDFGKVTTWRHVTLRVRHRFFAPDGSFVDVTTFGEGLDNSDKASNKAMSGAMKYALIELFSVPTSDVEDSDRTSPEITAAKRDPVDKPRPAKTAEAIPPALVDALASKLENASQKITPDQGKKLHIRFAQSLGPELKKNADPVLYDWLRREGYTDKDGKGTSLAIPAAKFAEVGKAAVAYAKALSLEPAQGDEDPSPGYIGEEFIA